MSTIEASKKSKRKYLICLAIILIATVASFMFSLWGQFSEVMGALTSANVWMVLAMIGLVFLTYFIDALVIKIFARLYTRKYSMANGLATSLTGQFFSDITPGASGGQVMQAYTLRNQGIPVSSAASIFVMSFILYQVALLLFDVGALIVEFDVVKNITTVRISSALEIPLWPIILFGFAINLIVTGTIYLLSYSKVFHHFVLHTCINFLGKLKIIKNPEKAQENLRVSVENYKIELKRLHSNIPVTVCIVFLYLLLLFIRDSIPYFSGLALNAYQDNTFSFEKMVDASFLGAFHQMITGLLPLPGSAGVSEYFFEILFYNFYGPTVDELGNTLRSASVNVASAQILWRVITFHLMFLISGIFVACYRNKPKEEFTNASRKTFVTLQISTLDERRLSADTMYETSKLSRKEIQKRLKNPMDSIKEKMNTRKDRSAERKRLEEQKRLEKRNKAKESSTDWDSIDINI